MGGGSLLNPHAILDTTVLIGSIAAQHAVVAERTSFTVGAVVASWLWFCSLGFFATLLRPIFTHRLAARILDGIVGVLILGIAYKLFSTEWLGG